MSSDQQHRLELAKATLFGRWLSPQEKIEPHLSTPGYELPDISDFGWHPVGTGTGNNWVVAPSEMANWAQNRRFDFASDAKDNVIVLGRNSTTSGRMLFRGSSNLAIFLGASASVNPVNVHFFSDHHVFFWGSGCTSNTTTFELGSDRTKIIVGQDCMFSAGIAVRTHDEHGILDLDSGAVLNVAGDVHFEPQVGWFGSFGLEGCQSGLRLGYCNQGGRHSNRAAEIDCGRSTRPGDPTEYRLGPRTDPWTQCASGSCHTRCSISRRLTDRIVGIQRADADPMPFLSRPGRGTQPPRLTPNKTRSCALQYDPLVKLGDGARHVWT